MQISIDKALNSKGRKFPFELCEKIVYNDGRICFDNPLNMSGEYSYNGSYVKINARVNGEINYNCDRCGKESVMDVSLALDERVFPKVTPDCDYTYDKGIICLDDMVFHNVLLSLPFQLLCDEDCKGICLGCYVNLNDEQCKCK